MQRCGGTAFITVTPSECAHRSFLIHTDRVFIVWGAGDDGGLESESVEVGEFPQLSPQWRCTSSGYSRGQQGPLCASYHQVVSDGTAASRSQKRNRVRRGRRGRGEGAQEEHAGMFPDETGSVKKKREIERCCLKGRLLYHLCWSHRCTVEECASLWWLNRTWTINEIATHKSQECAKDQDFSHYLSSSSHNCVLFDRLQFNKLMSCER